MCGIIGAVAARNIVPTLVQGLQQLEFRGYETCGLAVHASGASGPAGELRRLRGLARAADLAAQCEREHLAGHAGIAHTRWFTRGASEAANGHPYASWGPGAQGSDERPARVTLAHNGIIENREALRAELEARGYHFDTWTDAEVVAHLIDSLYEGDLLAAVQAAVARLQGSYAIAVLHRDEPHRLVGARQGSPLMLGLGPDGKESCLASDAEALAGLSDRLVYLEDGDIVDVQPGKHWIVDRAGRPAERKVHVVAAIGGSAELGPFRHYMQKEIFEQPRALGDSLERVSSITPALFDNGAPRADGEDAATTFGRIQRVLILACGTSFYAGSVARYWLESMAAIPCRVEIASEYRYRDPVPEPDTLVVTISQSGETADTLSALRHAQSLGLQHTLTICNAPASTLVRESRLNFPTRAGVEVGVASTKAFTAQLIGLFLLTLVLAKLRGRLDASQEAEHLKALRHLPVALQSVLALEPQLVAWAAQFAPRENALFLGRGKHYPIAQEGALKLKETSYIHAEGYAAGEFKHGPLALITNDVPVVVVAPNDALLQKLKNNMEEVRARGGELYALADAQTHIEPTDHLHVIQLPGDYGMLSPILHVVPLQMLAYHTAVARGTDVDKPRNLTKALTSE